MSDLKIKKIYINKFLLGKLANITVSHEKIR
jgi:hypothetical protein